MVFENILVIQPIGAVIGIIDDNLAASTIPGISSVEQIFSNAIFVAIVLVAAWIVYKIVNRWIHGMLSARNPGKALDEGAKKLYERLVKGIVLFVAFLIILNKFDIDVTSLVAVLGVGGIAVAFAAQETIANWIAGFILLVDKPFRVGDYIALDADGIRAGTVIDVGLRSTRVRTGGNTLITIPNAEFTKRDIYNFTANNDRKIKLYLPISIDYNSDVQKAKKILVKICKTTPGVLQKPNTPEVLISSLGDFSINLKLKAWIMDATQKSDVESALYERILIEFKKNKIEMPYPKQTIYVKK